VRIHVLGAGPAGLYFALLAKKSDPSRQITVFERNPAEATFGWGVVFSEETLGALRDADRRSYEDIRDAFATWDAIDIRYRSQTVRSRGHSFSAIGRKRLLNILQRRALELGVELRFEVEIPSPDELPGDGDLVVAADGVNSAIRRGFADAFRPTLDVHRTKYAWFGTDLVFSAFTFIFRETEHGLFQVHGYPFDGRTSTFIVECPEATWAGAGLDRATEEDSIAFCEKLFAEELQGHRLLSNRSLWTSFVTVRCESWHHGTLALMGDAAHTAHFTIGSGTKLAMEDAVALAQALERRRGDVRGALVDYEMERQPVVERFQQAARESSTYFENVRRYAAFEPIQFAFNLLTRSGRITHLELEKRDPAFVRRVDAWCAGSGETAAADVIVAPAPMFAPRELRGLRLANRIAVTAVGEDDAVEGTPGSAATARLTAAARSGAGLVLTEFVAVSAHGRFSPGTTGVYEEDHARAWANAVREMREVSPSVAVGLRLGHSGPRGSTSPRREGRDRPLREGGWPALAAWDVPFAPWMLPPNPMDPQRLGEVAEDFVAAARRAAGAGFDLLHLDLSHGSLLATFLSPLTNRRTDEFGGSPENRLRYPLEIVDAVRSVWPPDRPLSVRLTADDRIPGGMGPGEAAVVARSLVGHGVDLIQPVAGQTLAQDHPDFGRFYLIPMCDRIRNEAGIATLAGGGITANDEANTILAAGRADLCLLDTPLPAT
jgi:anthraniloyl-CoA monooxygenase